MKKVIIIFIIIIIAGAAFWLWGPKSAEEPTDSGQACIESGGTVRTSMCCKSTEDFPNLCLIGPCGCAPEYSHEVEVCDCGEGCWDGTQCTTLIPSFYHIENPPYYGETGWCWGSSAMMLLMDQGFNEEKIQEARTLIKTQGLGGPPDMFLAFREYDLIDKIRIAYSKDYSKESADFYNSQLLVNPEEQVIIFNNKEQALQKLKELISSDVLVIMIGHYGNHYTVVTGYDEDYIYINDPGADDVYLTKYGEEYKEKTKMTIDRFFEQWTVSGFEGGGINFPGDYGMIWLEKYQ